MKALFILFVCLQSVVCVAQYVPVGAIAMWTDGYVVTTKNDTIRGEIRVGSLVNDSPSAVIIRNADRTKTKLNGSDLRLIAQRLPDFAYATGSIPRDRDMVIFELVAKPGHNEKPMLLERLTPPGGPIALYFDASGWKKTTEHTFGNFVLESNREELSYVVLKNGAEMMIAKRGDLETIHEKLFGDCPAFIRHYPVASRRDWKLFGEMVYSYNQLCQ